MSRRITSIWGSRAGLVLDGVRGSSVGRIAFLACPTPPPKQTRSHEVPPSGGVQPGGTDLDRAIDACHRVGTANVFCAEVTMTSRRRLFTATGLAAGGAVLAGGTGAIASAATTAAADPWTTVVPAILARIKPPTFPAKDFPVTSYGAEGHGTTG